MKSSTRSRPSRTTTKTERVTTSERKTGDASASTQSSNVGGFTMTTKTSSYESSRSKSDTEAASAGGAYRSNVTIARTSRSRSPLHIKREEEKDELAHLNDRFALYIEYVRQLGLKNKDLVKKFKSVSQVETTDVESIKGMFEDELQSLRRALDDMAKERAALEVENRKMRAEWDDMKAKLARKEMEVRNLERKLEQYEKELSECRLDRERYFSLKREYDQEIKQIDGLKKTLELETRARSESEAKVMNLKKELDFQFNLHKEEKSKWAAQTVEIEEEIVDRTKADYDSRLTLELQLMRDQTAEEMRAYKMEIENTFNTKFATLKASSDRSAVDVSRSRDELYTVRKRYDEVNAELAKKQMEVESLMSRVADLEKLLDQERSDFEEQARIYREENKVLRLEMEKRFKEFNDLLATKINLDNEILAYRKLLESEEMRCNLSHEGREFLMKSRSNIEVDLDEEELESVDFSSRGDSSLSMDSSARYSSKMTTHGAVEISKCEVGESVMLRNLSNGDVVIGGWQLRYEADDKETVYKFPRNLTLRASDTCTVWSSESHTTHNPPHDLVMKGLTFFHGDKLSIVLLSKDEQEMAVCQMERDFTRRTASSSYTKRPMRAGSEERCSLM